MVLNACVAFVCIERCDSTSPANAVPTQSASRSEIPLIKVLYIVISQKSFAMKCHYSINSGKVKAFWCKNVNFKPKFTLKGKKHDKFNFLFYNAKKIQGKNERKL